VTQSQSTVAKKTNMNIRLTNAALQKSDGDHRRLAVVGEMVSRRRNPSSDRRL
jgi:hypothetical protein